MEKGAVKKMARDRAAGDELYRRLQLSLFLRIIMVTFLLGATIFIHFSRTSSFVTTPLVALYMLSGLTYLVTLISVISLRWVTRLNAFAIFQIVWEVMFVTALIYVTSSGASSIFSFLYLLAIIVAGILQYRRGTFLASVLSSILYGLLLVGMETGWITDLLKEYEGVGWYNLIYSYFINVSAMFGTAVLSSYLTEKLRVTGDELQVTMRDRDLLEALNDNIVHSISSGLITLDLDGRITSINEALQETIGVPMNKVLGSRFENLFPEIKTDDKKKLRLPPKHHMRIETNWTNPGNESRNLEFRVSPLYGTRKELLGSLVVCDDVTEIRKMEERLRKADRLAAVGQLAAGMAHEIRNPLASISGVIQMLESDVPNDGTTAKLMRIVVRETDRLDSLITDFLLFARPSPRTIEKFETDRMVNDLVEIYRHRTDIPAGVEWALDLEPGLVMETDPKLVEQILWNLINNAVDSIEGEGRISIGVAEVKAEDKDTGILDGKTDCPMIRIEVEDTGVGIPEEYKDRIFDPFFTTREKGTGLGLAMVYRITEALSGAVSVEDAPKQGTRFVLILPAVTPSASGEKKAAAEDEAAEEA